MKKFFKQTVFVSLLTLFLVLPFFALAQITNEGVMDRLRQTGEVAGFDAEADQYTLSRTIGMVVNVAMSLLGILFVILIVLAGHQWMIADGNDEQVKKAQDRIKNATIGLIVVVSAWALYRFVFSSIIIRMLT